MKASICVPCLFLAATIARCQVVEVGPGPPDRHFCDKINIEPNLVVHQTAKIFGRLIDPSGEPFRNSRVE